MNRNDVEMLITEYLKPIFGFALKRCRNLHDAEDLSQEIILKAFRALLVKDDIGDPDKFIWAIAHNALSNYYRDTAKSMVGVSLDEVSEGIEDPDALRDMEDKGNATSIRCLQEEIAHLSKIQREIVIAYYFENRKQSEIAEELDLPLGTIKWHLFEAKKELKRGMDTMRTTSELKFHPIKFHSCGINGKAGSKSFDEFFRSTLSQNICYCIRNTAKTVNEIADDLGVSPVYVETEVEFLEKYGFLQKQKGRYIVNFLISEPTAELLTLQNDMYRKAATLFFNELYDELMTSGLLDHEDIWCRQTDRPISLTESDPADPNFLLWSLIPYLAAWSGEDCREKRISFEEVATIRPDGGHNIVHASVLPDGIVLPEDYVYMDHWCGPMWNGDGEYILWQIDSQWSDRGEDHGFQNSEHAQRVLSLYEREEEEGVLSEDDYAWLSEFGYIKTNGDYHGQFKTAWQIVILSNKEIRDKLLAVGEKIKRKHWDEWDAIKAPYAKAVMASVPAHLRRIKEYELQFVFHSDGWFLLHGLVALLQQGKLKPPTEGQRKALTTLIFPQ